MTTQEIERWIWDEAQGCANLWFSAQVRNQFGHFHLWHRPGELAISEEKPDGFELSTGERIPPNQTIEQCAAWIQRRAVKLPILTPEMTQ